MAESALPRRADHVEVVLLYDATVGAGTVERALRALVRAGGRPPSGDAYTVSHWDDPAEPRTETSGVEGVADVVATWPTSTLAVRFDEFQVRLERDEELPLDSTDHLLLSAEKTPFKSTCPVPESEIEHRRNAFASVLADLIEVTEPHGGFGGPGPYPLGDPGNPQTVVDGIVSETFEVLYLREWAVDEIGRETVLNVPAWDVRELSTGGVLVFAVPPPDSCSMHVETCRQIADVLGLQPVHDRG